MGHRGFDEQMEALDALRGRALDAEETALVGRMLSNRNNFLVAKAARLAEENALTQFLPQMLSAFACFFDNGEKTDPQCWAKNALSRALPKLGCVDKNIFLRGLHYRQMEPTWGGPSDSAGTVRANCAHALVGCDGLPNEELLLLLMDLLADADKSVRVEAVRAIAQLGDVAVPVLRLRALIPGEDAEVTSACFGALLSVDRHASIPFVARFLAEADETAAEAAFALAQTHDERALKALLDTQRGGKRGGEPWFVRSLLSAIALTRLPEGWDYLIGLIEREDHHAADAIEALSKLSSAEELRGRLVKAVEEVGSPRLTRALREHLTPL